MASRWDAAERHAKEALEFAPDHPAALLIAGQAASRLKRDSDAIHRFQSATETRDAARVEAAFWAGKRLMQTGRASQAEEYFRLALKHDPSHLQSNSFLAELLQHQGRSWESLPFLRRELLEGHVAKSHIIMLGALDTAFSEDYQFV
ncbi:MAG: tetratricopeptide repeat protein, partial [Planctomycetales bacterium]|nr:tetratricopeptide repeat protein [Planctomycetales bacterium]